MSGYSDLSDYDWLTGNQAAALLDELAASEQPLHTAVADLRRRVSPQRAHLVIEQVDLRRRAAAKFSATARMFFTRTALEQATDENIARFKAMRIAQRVGSSKPQRVADLCCGIGGDLLSLAEHGNVIAVDNNPIVTLFAAANLRAVVPAADVQFDTADVADGHLDGVDAWHIDPDRRSTGRRTTAIEFCQPDLDALERLLRRVPHAAIKLASATQTPASWSERCELEWISRGGECRQLVAWHGELAEFPGQHRATILATARSIVGTADLTAGTPARTLTGNPNQSVPIAPRLCQYIFDVDPAVRAARLTGALVLEHELQALATGPTYLTGNSPISDPALACFHVDEILPLRAQILAKHLRDRHIGQLEIKKRGVDIVPEKLRRELKLRGETAATILITRIAGRPQAILAHRCDANS